MHRSQLRPLTCLLGTRAFCRTARCAAAPQEAVATPELAGPFAERVHYYQRRRDWHALLTAVQEDVPVGGVTRDTWMAGLTACFNLTDYEAAFRLLARMETVGPAADSEAYHMVILTCCNARHTEQAFRAFEAMVAAGVTASAATYTVLMSSCTDQGYCDMAADLFVRMLDAGVQPDAWVCGALMKAYATSGQTEEALQVLQWMEGAGVSLDVAAYNAAITACCAARQSSRAFDLVAAMQQADLYPDTRTGGMLISACGEIGDLTRAFEVLGWMQQHDVHINTAVCNALLKICVEPGEWQRAFALFDWMLDGGVPPDTQTCAILIQTCRVTGEWERARQVWEWMEEVRLAPNEYTCSALLSVFRTGGQWQRARDLLEWMQREGVPVNTVVYSAYLGVLVACAQHETLWEALVSAPTHGIEVDTALVNALLGGAIQAKAVTLAEEIWAWMDAEGPARNTDSYNVFLGAISSAPRAHQLLEDMVGQGLQPDRTTYKKLFRVALDSRDWDCFKALLRDLPTLNVVPTPTMFLTILHHEALAGPSGVQHMRQAFACLQQCGFQPDSGIFAALARACAMAGDLPAAYEVYAELQGTGLPISVEAYTSFARNFVEDYERVRGMAENMAEVGLAPDGQFQAALLAACARAGAWEHAEQIVARLEADGPVHPRALLSVLYAHANAGHWAGALGFVAARGDQLPLPRGRDLVCALATACGGSSEWERLRAWVRHQQQQAPGQREELTIALLGVCLARGWAPQASEIIAGAGGEPGSLLSAAAKAQCRTSADWAGVVAVVQHLHEGGIRLDAAGHGAVFLGGLYWLGPERLVALAEWLAEHGVPPEGRLRAAMRNELTASFRKLPPSEAVALTERLRTAGVALDLILCSHLLGARAKLRDLQGALAQLDWMEASGPRPDPVAYTQVLVLALDQDADTAWAVYQRARAAGVVDGYMHLWGLKAALRGNRLDRGVDVLREFGDPRRLDSARQKDMTSKVGALLRMARTAQGRDGGTATITEAVTLAERLRTVGLALDPLLCSHLLAIRGRFGDLPGALAQLDWMEASGPRPDPVIYTQVMRIAMAQGAADTTWAVYERARAARVVPDEAMRLWAWKAALRGNRLDRGVDVLREFGDPRRLDSAQQQEMALAAKSLMQLARAAGSAAAIATVTDALSNLGLTLSDAGAAAESGQQMAEAAELRAPLPFPAPGVRAAEAAGPCGPQVGPAGAALLAEAHAGGADPTRAPISHDSASGVVVGPGPAQYRARLEACQQCGDLPGAMQCLGLMREAGVLPDTATYRWLLRAHFTRKDVASDNASSGNVDAAGPRELEGSAGTNSAGGVGGDAAGAALDVFAQMHAAGVRLDAQDRDRLLGLCCRAQRWRDVRAVHQQCPLPRTRVAARMLLAAYCADGMWPAELLPEWAAAKSPAPVSDVVWARLRHMCCQAPLHEECQQRYRMLRSCRMRPAKDLVRLRTKIQKHWRKKRKRGAAAGEVSEAVPPAGLSPAPTPARASGPLTCMQAPGNPAERERLMAACIDSAQLREALGHLRALAREEVTPGQPLVAALGALCSSLGREDLLRGMSHMLRCPTGSGEVAGAKRQAKKGAVRGSRRQGGHSKGSWQRDVRGKGQQQGKRADGGAKTGRE